MKITLKLASFALAMGLSCLSTGSASAQAKQAVSNVTLATSSQHLAPREDSLDKQVKDPMGWAGIGVKVGMAGMSGGRLTVMGQEGRTQGRMGLHVAVPITLGGDGFGWMFEPYYMQSSISHDIKNSQGNVVGAENVGLTALGMYMGPIFNIHAADPLYIGFGLGLKGAYVMNKGFDYAADLHGRVPVHATFYINRTIAMTAEVGFGYGASAFADKPRVMIDPVSRSLKNVKDDPLFGLAYSWDATIGVRLP
jgi:hypothetical protein